MRQGACSSSVFEPRTVSFRPTLMCTSTRWRLACHHEWCHSWQRSAPRCTPSWAAPRLASVGSPTAQLAMLRPPGHARPSCLLVAWRLRRSSAFLLVRMAIISDSAHVFDTVRCKTCSMQDAGGKECMKLSSSILHTANLRKLRKKAQNGHTFGRLGPVSRHHCRCLGSNSEITHAPAAHRRQMARCAGKISL